MRAIDFNGRFENTLKLNNLTYTVKTEVVDYMQTMNYRIETKSFRVDTRHPKIECPVLVTLVRNTRGTRYNRHARSTHSCFVVIVPATGKAKVEHGLRNIWAWIHTLCMPL